MCLVCGFSSPLCMAFQKESQHVALAYLEFAKYTRMAITHKDPPASASQVFGLK
ncbi:hypothetical protein LEMLEM_LOCUS25569 [Lemmus lemmus]